METSAYLLIRASEAVRHNGYLEALEELWALPEVQYAEPVWGVYDCVARVEASMTRLISLVQELMAKSWVEGVQVLRADHLPEPVPDWEQARTARLRRQRASIWAYRRGFQRRPVSAQCPYDSRAAAIRLELEEARSLSRQLEIINAHCQKRHIPAMAACHR